MGGACVYLNVNIGSTDGGDRRECDEVGCTCPGGSPLMSLLRDETGFVEVKRRGGGSTPP